MSNPSTVPPFKPDEDRPLTYTSIHDALVELDNIKPDGHYLDLEDSLKVIGVSYIDDLLVVDTRTLSEASGIPIIKVAVLAGFAKDKVDHAKQNKPLDYRHSQFEDKENTFILI